jgi:hypothetical protein
MDRMDERFDRRELLLHLGDVLGALGLLAKASEPDASVMQLVQGNDSLQNIEFLRALSPNLTVAEFTQGAATAFSIWPKALLEAELNRDALASTVQHNLFNGNPDGWNLYIGYVQTKVAWFGSGLSHTNGGATAEAFRDAEHKAGPAEAPLLAASTALDVKARNEKRGWPWPEPRSTS